MRHIKKAELSYWHNDFFNKYEQVGRETIPDSQINFNCVASIDQYFDGERISNEATHWVRATSQKIPIVREPAPWEDQTKDSYHLIYLLKEK